MKETHAPDHHLHRLCQPVPGKRRRLPKPSTQLAKRKKKRPCLVTAGGQHECWAPPARLLSNLLAAKAPTPPQQTPATTALVRARHLGAPARRTFHDQRFAQQQAALTPDKSRKKNKPRPPTRLCNAKMAPAACTISQLVNRTHKSQIAKFNTHGSRTMRPPCRIPPKKCKITTKNGP